MRNRNRLLSLLLIGCLTLIVICAVLWRTSEKLQMENQALRAEINQLNAAPSVAPPLLDQGLAAEFETQKRELLRLRNEVAQLRSSRDAVKRAEEELARARGNRSQTPSTPAVAADGQSIASADWRLMGYETPEATLISGLWAMKEGQLASLLDTFTPEERQRFESQMAKRPGSEMAQRLQKELGQVTGMRVVGRHEMAAGEVVLDVYLEGIGKLKKYRMNQVNNEWKSGGPVNQNFNPLEPVPAVNPMTYYMSNPELMKRYFPQMYEMMQKKEEQAANGQSEAAAQ